MEIPLPSSKLVPFYAPEKTIYDRLKLIEFSDKDARNILCFWAWVHQTEPIIASILSLGRSDLQDLANLTAILAADPHGSSSDDIRFQFEWFPRFENFLNEESPEHFINLFNDHVGSKILWGGVGKVCFSKFKAAAVKGLECVEGSKNHWRTLPLRKPMADDHLLFTFDATQLQENRMLLVVEDQTLREALINADFQNAEAIRVQDVQGAVSCILRTWIFRLFKAYPRIIGPFFVSTFDASQPTVLSARVTIAYGSNSRRLIPQVYMFGTAQVLVESRTALSMELEPHIFSHSRLTSRQIQEYMTGIFGENSCLFVYNRRDESLAGGFTFVFQIFLP